MPIRVAIIKNTENNNLCALLVGMENGEAAIKKMVRRIPKRLNMKLQYDPAIPLLDIYPKEVKVGLE